MADPKKISDSFIINGIRVTRDFDKSLILIRKDGNVITDNVSISLTKSLFNQFVEDMIAIKEFINNDKEVLGPIQKDYIRPEEFMGDNADNTLPKPINLKNKK